MTEPNSPIPVSKSPFWQFSVKFYAVPGVAEACIELQDQANVDAGVSEVSRIVRRGVGGCGREQAEEEESEPSGHRSVLHETSLLNGDANSLVIWLNQRSILTIMSVLSIDVKLPNWPYVAFNSTTVAPAPPSSG